MERDDEAKRLLDQAFSAGDDWMRKHGVVTEFTLNTIIAFVYINFPNIKNVDIDLDRRGSKIYIYLHASIWRILLWILLGRRERVVDSVFDWVREYLPTYKVFVELRRSKGRREDEIKNLNNAGDDNGADLPELESVANISRAIRLNEVPLYSESDRAPATSSNEREE
jgi:hypothetical protein